MDRRENSPKALRGKPQAKASKRLIFSFAGI